MNKLLQTVFTLIVAAAPFAASAESYAYLVGIKDYPTPTDAQGNPLKDEKGNVIDNDLSGPVNDCDSIFGLLTSKYGYKADNVHKSYDKDANAKGFLENIKWLVTTAKAGDNVSFFYSGHGAQLENDKAKEPTPDDKIDECIVLADGAVVVDDLFDEVKGLLTSKGVNVTFVFDSCFSGGMSRDFMVNGRPAKDKFLNKAHTGANYKPMTQAMMNNFRPRVDSLKTRSMANAPGTAAWIYASKETEPSVDLGGAPDAPAHGLFTLLLTAVLEDSPKAPARDLVDAINEFATGKGFKQGPNTEFSSPSRAGQPVFLPNN